MRFTLVFALTLLLPYTTALAQSEEEARAQALYEQALQAFQDEEYESAAGLFRQSWELVGIDDLLYNEAIARANIRDFAGAIRASKQAAEGQLQENLIHRNHARLFAWLAHARSEEMAMAIEQTRALAAEKAKAVEAVATQPPTVPAPEPTGLSAGQWVGVGAMGLGGASLMTAGVLELMLRQTLQRMQDAQDRQALARYQSELERGRRQQLAAKITLFSGAGLVVTGLTIFLISNSKEDGTALQLYTGPGTIGVIADF